ncbi:MAG: WD40 repeat domain-containing protein, partial [Fimbriimonadaceae bacterium]|nr:WD40 repeat domain-containing protein [Fimbriimonadaceae bacterium]
HGSWVHCVAISLDGKTVASGSSDETIRLWDLETSELLGTIQTSGTVYSIDFAHSGKQIFSSGELTASCWDLEKQFALQVLPCYHDDVCQLVFSPDGQTLASSGWDNKIWLWDIDLGLVQSVLEDPDFPLITSLCFSSDGLTIAAGSYENWIDFWDIESNQIKTVLSGEMLFVLCLAFSADGRTLVSGSYDKYVRVWDLKTGELRQTIEAIKEGQTEHDTGVDSIVFLPKSLTFLTAGYDGEIKIWDAKTGGLNGILCGHSDSIYRLIVTNDGQTLASLSADNTIKVWDLKSSLLKWTAVFEAPTRNAFLFLPDGNTLVCGNSDNMIEFLDVETGAKK